MMDEDSILLCGFAKIFGWNCVLLFFLREENDANFVADFFRV